MSQYQPPSTPPQQRRGCGGCLGRAFVAALILMTFAVFAGVVIVSGIIYVNWSQELEVGISRLNEARTRETFETSYITDRHGELLWEIFGEGNRTRIPLSQIPQDVIYATVAVEDDTFYENIGLDAPSLIAALVANLRDPDGRPVGGSTITQQIVRHIAFDYEERTAVSYNRKAKEIVLAWMMTRNFSKDEILEMYLNEIYYGNLAYGIEAAAQTYFDKPAAQLTTAEATLLAALPQSPVELDPLTNLQAAKERQWLVLNLMASEGYLDSTQLNTLYQEPLTFAPQEVSLTAPHFAVYVRQLLEAQFGADFVANGGLRVTTSLDLNYQRLAEQLARQHVTAVGPEHNLTNAALIAMKPGTGEILAMLGSVDYRNETIDGHVNVTLTPQQPGSAIKPLTYAAALSPSTEGDISWTAADILWDVEVEYPQANGDSYAPLNYDRRFHGPVRLRQALANSYNVPAVLLLQDIGVPALLEFAQRMGINSWQSDPSQYGLSLTLGGGELTPLELTTAYATFANEGQRVAPISILRVERNNGELLYEYQPPAASEQVLDRRVAYLISSILDDDTARVPAMGRENPLALPFPAAAKTGTTNDFRDNWTMGYTPGLVVGIWTGNTDNSEMLNISGLTGAAPLWSDYMQAVYGNYDLLNTLATNGVVPAGEFAQPQGLEQRSLCNLGSVTLGATNCTPGGTELFLVTDAAQATPQPDSVAWEQLEPAVWRIPAVPLPPVPTEVVLADTMVDDDAPPPQLFCHFQQGTELTVLPPDAQPQLFLSPPRNRESLKGAHEWAQANNVALLPTAVCNEELLALARNPNVPAIWRITSPKTGDEVSGILPIVGTADFDPGVVQFYKIELGIPKGGGQIDWLTLGETHSTPVVNGTLEMFHADALPPGDYFLRLIVVKDSNYVGDPHTIAVTVVAP